MTSLQDEIDEWEASHAAEMEVERELEKDLYPDGDEHDYNPKIKKKLKFDEFTSLPTQSQSIDLVVEDTPTPKQKQQKQSRAREESISPPKQKRSRVTTPRNYHSSIPLAGPHMTITSFNGRRVFVPLAEYDDDSEASKLTHQPTGQLLSTPIEFLQAQLDSRERAEALRGAETRRVPREEEVLPVSDGLLWVDKYSPKSFPELLSDEKTNREVLSWLKEWDKVVFGTSRPTPTVVPAATTSSPFKKSFQNPKKPVSTASPTSSPSKDQSKGWRKGSRFDNKKDNTASPQKATYANNNHTTEEPHDSTPGVKYMGNKKFVDNGMPRYKAVLLCGPPGLGKTTLAHVLAKHAGYNPVEINASDDRKEKVFESKVYAAIGMQSVMGNKKPNCLIIDEIDGVEGRESNTTIEMLVRLITAEKKQKKQKKDKAEEDENGKKVKKTKKVKVSNHNDESGSENEEEADKPAKAGKGGKKNKESLKDMILQRPIICICNDMYVPALRKLRNVAKIFHFTKPLTTRVTARLKQICQLEGVIADSHSLTALTELTNCDTRSCLHTLQFIKAKSAALTPALLASSALGIKDKSKSLFEVWHEIFGHTRAEATQRNRIMQEVRRRATASSIDTTLAQDKEGDGEGEPAESRFNALNAAISATGEVDKVTEGCFENYLTVIHADSLLDKSQICLNWLIFGDELSKQIRSGQHFELMKYESMVPMAFAYKASAITAPSVRFPKADYEVWMQTKQHQSTIRSFMLELPPELRSTINERVFVLDYISAFLDILGPTVRPVNPQLFNEGEKATLNRLVEVMASHKLTYVRDTTTTNGQPSMAPGGRHPLYKLDPPIESVSTFSDRTAPHALAAHHLRYLLASQVNNAIFQAQLEELNGKDPKPATPAPTTVIAKTPPKPKPKPSTPAPPTAVAKDFFGRPIVPKASPPSTPASQPSPQNSPPSSPSSSTSTMRYKWNEGFSNAVRRTVYVKDFL